MQQKDVYEEEETAYLTQAAYFSSQKSVFP